MKKRLRKDKREWANNIANEAEDAAKCGQMKDVYDATRRLCSEPPKKIGKHGKEQRRQFVDKRRGGATKMERALC